MPDNALHGPAATRTSEALPTPEGLPCGRSPSRNAQARGRACPAMAGTDPRSVFRDMEKHHRAIAQALATKEFESAEEASVYLNQMLQGDALPDPDDPASRAQELAFEAWDAPDRKSAVRLAKQALEIDPACVDAYNVLAECAPSAQQAGTLYRKGLAAWEQTHAEALREWRGEFWGIVETRPYMRALGGLALALTAVAKADAACEVWQRMLELNPNDNQGVRAPLLAHHLEAGRLEEAGRIVRAYDDDAGADFIWSRVLYEYLTKGPDEAKRTVRQARKWNRHVHPMLVGRRRPGRVGDSVAMGSPEEAAYALSVCGPAWLAHPEALAWLSTDL